MACLGQHLSLVILDDYTEGVLLNLDAAVCRTGRRHIGTVPSVHSLRSTRGLSLACLKCLAEHDIVSIGILRLHGCRQHPDSRRPWRYPLYLNLQRRVVLIGSIWEVQHLHPHRPVAVQVKRLARTHPVAFPLYQSLALLGIKTHKTICYEICIRQVIEIRRHILLHTLQILNTCIRLNLRIHSCYAQKCTHGT